jgi:hypothetical protein
LQQSDDQRGIEIGLPNCHALASANRADRFALLMADDKNAPDNSGRNEFGDLTAWMLNQSVYDGCCPNTTFASRDKFKAVGNSQRLAAP